MIIDIQLDHEPFKTFSNILDKDASYTIVSYTITNITERCTAPAQKLEDYFQRVHPSKRFTIQNSKNETSHSFPSLNNTKLLVH